MNLGTAGCAASDVDVHLLITRLGPNKHGRLIEHGNHYGRCKTLKKKQCLFQGEALSEVVQRKIYQLKIQRTENLWVGKRWLSEGVVWNCKKRCQDVVPGRLDSVIVSNTWIWTKRGGYFPHCNPSTRMSVILPKTVLPSNCEDITSMSSRYISLLPSYLLLPITKIVISSVLRSQKQTSLTQQRMFCYEYDNSIQFKTPLYPRCRNYVSKQLNGKQKQTANDCK